MKSKLTFVVILALLGLLTSLLVSIPMLSATDGAAAILDGAEGDEIGWTNPGDTVFLSVTDADLNLPIKNVINAGSADVTAQPGTVTTDGTTALVHSTSTGLTLIVGDTVLVDDETVREVTARNGTSTTVNIAFSTSVAGVDAFEVDVTGGEFDNCPDCAAAIVVTDTITDGTTLRVFVDDLFDLGDSQVGDDFTERFDGTDADGRTDRRDVFVEETDGDAIPDTLTFDVGSGSIDLINNTGADFTSDLAIVFWSAGTNTVGDATTDSSVTVTSEADPVGIGVVLTETGADTGIFEAEIGMCTTTGCSDADAATPLIEVSSEVNDTITVDYDDADADDADASASISVESVDPEFDNLSPDSGFATKNDRPTLSGDITDADSGVLQDEDVDETITVVMQITDTTTNRAVLDLPGAVDNPRNVDPAQDGTVEAISGGFNAIQLVPGDFDSNADEYIIQWWITSEDAARNKGVSDEDADTTCDPDAFDIDATTPGTEDGGCDPFEVRVDNVAPAISSATTGNSWDADTEAVLTGTDAIATSIQIVFDEDLDGDSITVADFESTDVDIEDVDFFSDSPTSVFLTVEAIDSDLEPEITLVDDAGGISDEAGNINDEDEVDADDGIPATLSVAVTGTAASRPLTNEEITIVVTSDEALTGTPNVFAFRIEDDSETAGANEAANETTKTGTLEWTATFDVGSPGLYNVYVTATDLGSRLLDAATLGTAAEAAAVEIDIADDDVILFEVDTGIPDPVTAPADEGETDNTSPFITLNFANEGTEYGLDDADDFTTTPADVDTNHDEHATVSISAITLDGDDILADVSTDDDIEFLYKATDLALGDHEVVLTYMDETYDAVDEVGGNEVEDFTFTFTVVERADFEIPLDPGWNLVSLPGTPADGSIDVVVGDTPVTRVYSFDPAMPGGWMVALRDSEGDEFAGTLTSIDADHGYWMLTDSFESLEVDIPPFEAGAEVGDLPPSPPTIDVAEGWNLLPVRDVTSGLSAGDTIDASVYYAGLEISRVYGFDTVGNVWELVSPDADVDTDTIEVGKAYWLFATAIGVLVP